jgi:hypothetical protein
MLLSSTTKIKKKNSSFYNANSLIVTQEKSLTNSIVSQKNYINKNDKIIQKKIENPIEFIKQKKKYFLQDFFDVKGTKDFIASKEQALEEIKLNDEILFEDKRKKIRKNKKVVLDTSNRNIKEPLKNKKRRKRRAMSCIYEHIDIEDKKFNKRKKISNSKKKIESNIYDNRNYKIKESENNNDNNVFIIDNKINESKDSKDSNYIYKFIIDNANESDEKFNKKFEKVIEKYEKKNKKEIPISTVFTNKEKFRAEEMVKYKSTLFYNTVINKDNNFDFSAKTKGLMVNDDLSVSAISNAYNVSNNGKINKKNNKLSRKKERRRSQIIFSEKVRRFLNDDSIISVLDDLI